MSSKTPQPTGAIISSKVFLQHHDSQEGEIRLKNGRLTLYGEQNALFLDCGVHDVTRVLSDGWQYLIMYIPGKKPEMLYFSEPLASSLSNRMQQIFEHKQSEQELRPWLDYFKQQGVPKVRTTLKTTLLVTLGILTLLIVMIYLYMR